MDSRFDDLLHTVIVEKGQGIYGFFDVVLGFMYRRTDFFYEMAPGENMGFFPGQAEAIIYNYFRKYQNIHFKERVPKRNIDPKEIEDFMKKQKELKDSKEQKVEPKKEIEKINTNREKNVEITKKPESTIEIQQKIPLTEIKVSQDITPSTIKTELKKSETIQKPDSISVYNGDSCDNYNWSQGVMDVTIQIVLPPNTAKQMVRIIFMFKNFI
jgi:hypothetical protein